MILIRVDFPAPLSPTIACTSFGRSAKLASRNDTTRPKCFCTFRTSSRDGDGGCVLEDDIVALDPRLTIPDAGAGVKRSPGRPRPPLVSERCRTLWRADTRR